MKNKIVLAALPLLSLCVTTWTSNVMEMPNGNYVVDDRSSSGSAGTYAAANEEAEAFCQHKALRTVVVGTRPFDIVPSNQQDIYPYSNGVSRFGSGGGTGSVGGAMLAFRCR
jgi:hypothetical protein